MSDVRLVGISKRYEAGASRPALERLDLTIPSGELVVLVGPSGCGKSTTLRILAGLEEPSSGQVFIGDRDVTHVPPAERDIAMVFQSYALYPHMTVFENLAFALRMRRMPTAEIRARVEAAARALSIVELLERRPKQLSGGQRQRVAIGRAVVREPKVFLFDEPLSNLDAVLRSEMRREIARIQGTTNTTSMYVTHDQVEAMTLADRIVVLKAGVVQQVGSPMEIYDRPANRFVAGFFGTPAMSFLPAALSERAGTRVARGPGYELALPGERGADDELGADGERGGATGGEVVIGVRPEAAGLDAGAGGAALRTEVLLREVLGAEVLLHLGSTAGPLTIRTDARSPAREGDALTVWIDPAKVHLFDAASERRL